MAESDADKYVRITQVLESGVSQNSMDGNSTTIDHDTLRREQHRLAVKLGLKKRRARVLNVDMGAQ